jgi:hypothetical protein
MKKLDNALIGLGAIVILILAIVIGGYRHTAALEHESTQVSIQLSNEGVTGIGSPDVGNHWVPFHFGTANQCTVDMHYAVAKDKTITLEIAWPDAAGHIIDSSTDGIDNAGSAAEARTNLVTAAAKDPNNQVCPK